MIDAFVVRTDVDYSFRSLGVESMMMCSCRRKIAPSQRNNHKERTTFARTCDKWKIV